MLTSRIACCSRSLKKFSRTLHFRKNLLTTQKTSIFPNQRLFLQNPTFQTVASTGPIHLTAKLFSSVSQPTMSGEVALPKGVKINWDFRTLTPEELHNKTTTLIEDAKNIYDKVASVKAEEVSYETIIKPLADIDVDLTTFSAPLTFAQEVSLSKELRDASSEADQLLENFKVEMSMRKDLFDQVVAYREKSGMSGLKPEAARYVERLIKEGKRSGLHLSEEVRGKVKSIKKRIAELGIQFQRNCNEDTTELAFSDEELAGVPQDFIDTLDKNEEGKRRVTLKYPHFFPVTRKCRVPETRRVLETAYQARCIKENTPILEELVSLRQQQADLLGYPNHASYIQEMRMAKKPEKVHSFLTELAEKLQPLWAKERETMLQLKEEECKQYGYEFNNKLDFWDARYYMSLIEEKHYAVDQNQLKVYFPMDKVTQGLLEIYQDLLGLSFYEETNAVKWHDDVKMYRVEDTETKKLYGYFYLDLFPRDGKFGHAAVFPLQPSCVAPNGERQVSVVAMVANFTKPTKDKPSLLDHKEVETYFHEFGHVMHQICSEAEFAMFSGTRVERDFVEAPSQMLENWVWEEKPLLKMSGHYLDGSPLPDDLITKLVESKKANAGSFNLRQIVLATFDQLIHTRAQANTQELFSETYKKIMDIDTIPGTNMPASFGHLAGGYDAQYYGYLWSEVYSADMFESRFAKEGIFDPKVGRDYRNCILGPGGSIDADVMLVNFLGREPTPDAFLRSKGIETSA